MKILSLNFLQETPSRMPHVEDHTLHFIFPAQIILTSTLVASAWDISATMHRIIEWTLNARIIASMLTHVLN